MILQLLLNLQFQPIKHHVQHILSQHLIIRIANVYQAMKILAEYAH